MSSSTYIASVSPIQQFHREGNNHPFESGDARKLVLPFSLPYVYQIGFLKENIEIINFIDETMEIGDVVELYIYEEGRHGRMLSHNYSEEARTINLLRMTYKDRIGEYQLSGKNGNKNYPDEQLPLIEV